MYLNNKTLLQ